MILEKVEQFEKNWPVKQVDSFLTFYDNGTNLFSTETMPRIEWSMQSKCSWLVEVKCMEHV